MKVGSNFAFGRLNNVTQTYQESATKEGIGFKTLILLSTALITSLVFINVALRINYMPIYTYIIAGVIAFILNLIMVLSPLKAKYLSIPYAISEGLIIGCICELLELVLPGMGLRIASLALLVTLSVFVGGAFLYMKGIIKVGQKFKAMLFSFSIGIIVFSLCFGIMALVSFLTTGVNLYSIYYFSGLGIIGSIIMCIVATLYVIVSFDNATQIVDSGADKDYEWYASYAITLNVIYLFFEILRLILIILSNSSKRK